MGGFGILPLFAFVNAGVPLRVCRLPTFFILCL